MSPTGFIPGLRHAPREIETRTRLIAIYVRIHDGLLSPTFDASAAASGCRLPPPVSGRSRTVSLLVTTQSARGQAKPHASGSRPYPARPGRAPATAAAAENERLGRMREAPKAGAAPAPAPARPPGGVPRP